eukprot:gene5037-5696_t
MAKITWMEKKVNEYIWNKVTRILDGRQERVLEIIMRRKLKYLGHQMRRNGLAKALIEGNVEGDRDR